MNNPANDNTELKNSFIFYRSFHETILELEPQDQLELYQAITFYGLDETIPTFSKNYLTAIFKSITPNMERASNRYKANVENGKKGGRPKKVKESISDDGIVYDDSIALSNETILIENPEVEYELEEPMTQETKQTLQQVYNKWEGTKPTEYQLFQYMGNSGRLKEYEKHWTFITSPVVETKEVEVNIDLIPKYESNQEGINVSIPPSGYTQEEINAVKSIEIPQQKPVEVIEEEEEITDPHKLAIKNIYDAKCRYTKDGTNMNPGDFHSMTNDEFKWIGIGFNDLTNIPHNDFKNFWIRYQEIVELKNKLVVTE